eukprot:NODE_644_length_5619_cov_0.132790.p2 type:complete len:386 gc:universal NODE_644_length_5619_cov_0.132790:996-2153(+)
MQRVFILSASRTPIGSFNGSLKSKSAVELGVIAATSAIKSSKIQASDIQDAYIGHVLSGNTKQAPARQVVLGSKLPTSTEATGINKVCASGLKAVTIGAQQIMTGVRDVVLVGGMESMSNVPYYVNRQLKYGHSELIDGVLGDGLTDVYNKFHMGNCGENTAKQLKITRQDQDEFAINSYTKATKAWKSGFFSKEIAPVEIKSRKGSTLVSEDEEYRNFNPEKMNALKSAFIKDGTITAANASKLNDGASALIIASESYVSKHSLKPLAEIIGFSDGAVAPIDFPIAPSVAVPLSLKRANIKSEQIDHWEINEAFSCVVLANAKLLKLDLNKVNPFGGAVSLGHPIGSSGSRILTTLVHGLKGEYGCASICNGGGAATSLVIKKI